MAKKSWILSSLLLCATVAADMRLDGGANGWDTNEWFVVVDGVMGGQSSGNMEFDNKGSLFFSGDIITDGGGFSSVRRRFDDPIDLTPYAGVVIELETTRAFDPMENPSPMGLHLQFGDVPTSYGYASAFAIPLAPMEGMETAVYLPLESFDRADWRGMVCRGDARCTFDPTRVNSLEIDVLFQEGPFELRVKSITAVTDPTSFPTPTISMASSSDVQRLVEHTIEMGGGLYDYGYPELCNAIYRSTLNSLLAADGGAVSDAEKTTICDSLQRAATFSASGDKGEVAWMLRGTLDSLLDGSSATTTAQQWAQQCVPVTSFVG